MRPRRTERGVALVVVVIFTFISLMTMTATYQAIQQAYAFEESSDRIASGGDGTGRALGIAIARLQSGIPTLSPFECRLRLRSTDGSSIQDFKLTHTQLDVDSWTVHAEPTSDTLDLCPGRYTETCPLVIP